MGQDPLHAGQGDTNMVEAAKQDSAKQAAKSDKDETKNGAKAAAPDVVDFDKLAGTEVFTDRLTYKPELCKSAPLVGYVVDELNLPKKKGEQGTWGVYVFLLTRGTLVCDREDNVVPAKKGQEIMIPKNVKLAFLSKWARNPEVMTEVAIQPDQQVDLGGGKSMWTFRQKVMSEMPRLPAYRLASPNAVAPEILPEASSDIPF